MYEMPFYGEIILTYGWKVEIECIEKYQSKYLPNHVN